MDYSTLKNSVLKELKNSPSLRSELRKLSAKCSKGTAKYVDAVKFSEKLGIESARLIKDTLQNGEEIVLSEFAEQFIAPVYTSLQKTTLSATKNVQKSINKKNGLSINPSEVKADGSRVKHIVARYREAESFDDVSFLLGKDVIKNITRAAVSDTIRTNASDQQRAGFKVTLVRTDGTGCCDYCSGLVGSFVKGQEPDDFWKVHKGCSCEFEYHSELSGAHHKISFSSNDEGKLKKNTEDI